VTLTPKLLQESRKFKILEAADVLIHFVKFIHDEVTGENMGVFIQANNETEKENVGGEEEYDNGEEDAVVLVPPPNTPGDKIVSEYCVLLTFFIVLLLATNLLKKFV